MTQVECVNEMLNALRRMQKIRLGRTAGLNQAEYVLLRIIHTLICEAHSDAVHVFTLIKELGISGPAVSRMLKILESKHLVRRDTDPADRRNTLVSITEKGMKAKELADAYAFGIFAKVTEIVGTHEMDEFRRIFLRLADALTEISGKYEADEMGK